MGVMVVAMITLRMMIVAVTTVAGCSIGLVGHLGTDFLASEEDPLFTRAGARLQRRGR